MRNTSDARCAHCQYLFNGQCQAAQDHLLAVGFPLLAVRPKPETVADSCPDYQPDLDERQPIEDARIQMKREARRATAKHFSLP